MFGYTCTVFLFPLALQGFSNEDLKIMELRSTKREEDLQILGRSYICFFAFFIDLGK